MAKSDDLREAMLAEAIGDLQLVLDKAEALPRLIENARLGAESAHGDLSRQLDNFEDRVRSIADIARDKVAKHVVKVVEDAANRARDRQIEAMTEAARTLFAQEINHALRRIVAAMQGCNKRPENWPKKLAAHTLTAALAATASWGLAILLLHPAG